MTISEKRALFKKYQNSSMFHPMTCGNDSGHEKLEVCVNGHFLYCLNCEYTQELEVEFYEKLDKLLTNSPTLKGS